MRTAIRLAAVLLLPALLLAGCGDEKNLWSRDFAKSPAGRPAWPQVTGYWEGEVAMGGVRTRIEPDRMTIALRCDSAGKILSQGSAPIVFEKGDRPKIVLQSDLSGGSPDWCGFRFYKGNEFAYTLGGDGTLRLNFAGSSVAQLRRLDDADPHR